MTEDVKVELSELAKETAQSNPVARYAYMLMLTTLIKQVGNGDKAWSLVEAMHEYHKECAPEDVKGELDIIFKEFFSNITDHEKAT